MSYCSKQPFNALLRAIVLDFSILNCFWIFKILLKEKESKKKTSD